MNNRKAIVYDSQYMRYDPRFRDLTRGEMHTLATLLNPFITKTNDNKTINRYSLRCEVGDEFIKVTSTENFVEFRAERWRATIYTRTTLEGRIMTRGELRDYYKAFVSDLTRMRMIVE